MKQVQIDTKLIGDDDGKVYKSCDQGDESQKEDAFDVGFKVWRTCLVSGIINVVLFGILACQGIHLVVSEVLPTFSSLIAFQTGRLL